MRRARATSFCASTGPAGEVSGFADSEWLSIQVENLRPSDAAMRFGAGPGSTSFDVSMAVSISTRGGVSSVRMPADIATLEELVRGAALAAGAAMAPPIAGCDEPATVPQPQVSATTSASAAPAETASGSAGRTSERARPPPASLLLDDSGVGDVRIGKAIAASHLAPDADAKQRYAIRWIADAQPLEAFRVGDPPVLAVIRGPFTRWAKNHHGPLEPERFVDAALREARAGAKVESILIEASGPRTSAGVGVGSTFAELESAHASAKLSRLPPEFGKGPTCRVTIAELGHVWFQLRSCAGNERGDVIRIRVVPAT